MNESEEVEANQKEGLMSENKDVVSQNVKGVSETISQVGKIESNGSQSHLKTLLSFSDMLFSRTLFIGL